MTEIKKSFFNKDFTLVVIGQIISLFGNAILRYVLPLYLLNQTHSAALFGAVSACAIIPMVVFAPIGGIVADRVNKRNIMVALDFITAGIMATYAFSLGKTDMVITIIIVLMLLYGISGAYQPAVQASIPVLEKKENLNSANAMINMVNSLSSMFGPVIGGIIYAPLGIYPVLYISIICFTASAVMEIFICIPFVKRENNKNAFAIAGDDLRDGVKYITKGNPITGQMALVSCGINLILSALITVGLPVIITEYLGFKQATGNELYGYALGVMGAGGLAGGFLASLLGKKLRIRYAYLCILGSTLALIPMTFAVVFTSRPYLSYFEIIVPCFMMTVLASLYNVQTSSYYQLSTPGELLGKVMAFMSCISMCASPIGQAIYGVLFEALRSRMYIITLVSLAFGLVLSYCSKITIAKIPQD